MFYTGNLILIFALLHIAHYTLGYVQQVVDTDGVTKSLLDLRDTHVPPRHDVYRMIIAGFTNPIIAVLYIFAQLALMLHLSHGVASLFQSLGLNTPRTQSTFKLLGWAVTLLVGGGNIAIVLAVWFGMLK